MTDDRFPGPMTAPTYDGFAYEPPETTRVLAEPRAARGVPSRTLLFAGGAAAALAIGLLFGFVLRPHLAQAEAATLMAPVSQADADRVTGQRLNIDIAQAAPLSAPKAAGKLDVLPASTVSSTALAPPAPQAAHQAAPACASGTPAEQMVCADPGLTAADRALSRAYRRAMASGVEPERLREDQRDWLEAREDAAQRSPRAVADLYRERIGDLNEIADDPRN